MVICLIIRKSELLH